MNLQEKALTQGYEYVTPEHIHNAITDRVSAHGLNVDAYFANPATYQPPEKGPGLQEQIAQAQLQLENKRLDIEEQKAQMDAQIKLSMAELRERELFMKAQVDQMKSQMDNERMAINEQSQIMQARTAELEALFNVEMSRRDQEWQETVDVLKLEMDQYKAELKAQTDLETHNATNQ